MKTKTKQANRPFVESYAEKAGLTKANKAAHPRLYYLCGAVSNDPYAQLKFDLAELYLKAKGHMVINPLKTCPIGTTWEEAISTDLYIINQMKDMYMALLHLSKYMDEKHIYYPTIVDIDPEARFIESRGKRLERGISFDVLPYVVLPSEWHGILMYAIEEYEREVKHGEEH